MDPHETKVYITVIITSVVIGFILVYFVLKVLRNHHRYFEQQRKQFLSEIELLEAERNRIAQDLHDELGPTLAMVRMQILKGLPGHPGSAELDQAASNIATILDRLGNIARNLRPQPLIDIGLEIALDQFVVQFKSATAMRIDLDYQITNELPSETGIHIFRMVQELLNNAFRHSGAKYVALRLFQEGKKIFLVYHDNGKGFLKDRQRPNSLGLTGLHNRVQLLGGRIICRTGLEKGTEYFIELPQRPS